MSAYTARQKFRLSRLAAQLSLKTRHAFRAYLTRMRSIPRLLPAPRLRAGTTVFKVENFMAGFTVSYEN